MESVCTNLSQQDAEELRANVNRVIKASQKSKLNKEEAQAIRRLKRDKDRLVFTANKGVAMVVMDRWNYINKSNSLSAQSAHRPIPRDHTNKIKTKLITMLRKVRNETG